MLKIIMSPSASVAVTVPIAVWFSSALKDDDEVMTGAVLVFIVIPPLLAP